MRLTENGWTPVVETEHSLATAFAIAEHASLYPEKTEACVFLTSSDAPIASFIHGLCVKLHGKPFPG